MVRFVRLIAAWLITGAIVFGCTNVGRAPGQGGSPQSQAGVSDKAVPAPDNLLSPAVFAAASQSLVIKLWPVSVVVGALLCIGAWRSPRYRGTCLGVVFGALGEIVFVRRVDQQYQGPIVVLLVICLVAVIVLEVGKRWSTPVAAAPGALASRLIAPLSEDRQASPDAAVPIADEPRTGLVAFGVVAVVLILLDSLGVPRWLG